VREVTPVTIRRRARLVKTTTRLASLATVVIRTVRRRGRAATPSSKSGAEWQRVPNFKE
jgi:hypothetical protein